MKQALGALILGVLVLLIVLRQLGCYKGVLFSSTDEPAVIPSEPGLLFGAPILFFVLCSPQGLCRPVSYKGQTLPTGLRV